MSPDARLIAASVLAVIARREDGTYEVNAEDVSRWVADLELAIPDTFTVQEFSPETAKLRPQPGIRGMVPVAYLKDIIQGALDRMYAHQTNPTIVPVTEAREYLERRLADPVTFDAVPVQQVDEWLTRLERWVNRETDGYTDAVRLATLRAVLYNVRFELGRVP